MPMNSGRDYVAREVEVAQPLMAAGPVGGNQGGDFVVQPICFVQNSRSEVRLVNGDGQITGAIAAEPGAQQQHYIAQSVAETLRAGGNTTGGHRPPGTGADTAATYLVPITSVYTIQERAVSENPDAGPQGKGYQAGLAYTLEARNKVQSVAADMAVRRLMPVECERLQGFPDHYTLVPVGKKMAADGPRYKQLGNSWAVPHARWVGQRVADELARLDAIRPIGANENDLTALLWTLAA